ncbi:MAG: hypothetical protein ACI9EZ_001560 [Halobacteriales archaeon]|jgi:hypothetical protein
MGSERWVLIVVIVVALSGCLVSTGSTDSIYSDGPASNIPQGDPIVVPVDRGAGDRTLDVTDPPYPIRNETVMPANPDGRPGVADFPPGKVGREVTVVVGVVNSANQSRNVGPLVERTLSYWEHNAREYVGYGVDFELEPDAEDPDVIVSFQRTVDCHGETGWLGCAPDVETVDTRSETMVVAVKGGYQNDSMVKTLKHEIGHVLGLDHGEEPMPLMSAQQESLKLQETNAANRTFPWNDRNISVYVDYTTISSARRVDVAEQVSHALEFYEEQANHSMWANVSFAPTRQRDDADVRIDFVKESPLLQEAGSIGRPKGPDLDGDGRVEYYTESRIVVSNVQTDVIGWHVGYWIGVSLGADNASELPPPFTNGTRTGDWWREGS